MEEKLSPSIELQDVTVQTELLPSRFSKVAVIGQGGMGLVLHAVDQTLQRDVAVKLLNFDGSRTEEVHERFLREAKALASLDHVNVVKILASGITDDGNPYHVLEFLDGEPLSAVLSKLSTLPIPRFFNIMEQVCQGLIHAHEKNIVHRDLKPSNIFLLKDLDGSELVKVIDFGIARLLMPDLSTDSLSLTRTNLLLGSPAYMSPEQCNCAKVDHRSDIYSLGCVMYECLTGEPPFTAGSGMELMYKHMREEAPKLETQAKTESQRQLARLIERCLRKAPEERPESINSIAAELKEISLSDSNIKEFYPARRENKFWTNEKIIRIIVLSSAFLFACIFAISNSQQNQKLNSDQTFAYKPPAEVMSKVKELKSSFVALKKTLDSKPTDAVRKETLDSLVDKAIEYSQLKTWSHQDGIDLLNIASNYCDESKDHDLLLKAKLIEQRATAESFQNQDTFESSFEEAIELIRRATKSQTSDEEVDARKNIVMHYLSKVDSSSTENFSKAKENYIKLEQIWKVKPIHRTAEGDDPAILASKQMAQQHGSFGILVDKPALRFASCDFALEAYDFMISRGERENAEKWLRVILDALTAMKGDIPRGDKHFNAMVAHAHRLLAQVLREEGELDAAKIHEDEAEKLSR